MQFEKKNPAFSIACTMPPLLIVLQFPTVPAHKQVWKQVVDIFLPCPFPYLQTDRQTQASQAFRLMLKCAKRNSPSQSMDSELNGKEMCNCRTVPRLVNVVLG